MCWRWKGGTVEALSTNMSEVQAAVFDPSHRKGDSYWQWSNVAPDSDWEAAAAAVHKGWPLKLGTFEDQSAVCFGVLDTGPSHRWLYRVFPGGRDDYGRPGR